LHGRVPLFSIVLLFVFVLPAFAKGSAEKAPVPLNPEWNLCVTAFDVSAVPVSRQAIGDIMTRSLINAVHTLKQHNRSAEEYAYYEEYAWSKARTTAAQALSKRRGERDQLVFHGDPDWKYRSTVKTANTDIAKLEQALEKVNQEPPVIEKRPAIKIVETNLPRPRAGDEALFCVKQKADAFLAGSLSEFHGRITMTITVYTLYNNAYQYENTVLFSAEDTAMMVDELASALITALSGEPSARIALQVEPATALISLDNTFAGQGSVSERPYQAGAVSIDMYAENYEPYSTQFTLNPDETKHVSFTMTPLSYALFTVQSPEPAAVYWGGLYMGQTPLDITVPAGRYEYLQLETAGGETAQTVFMGQAGTVQPLSLNLKAPVQAPGRTTENARKTFYNAFGRFWIALPVAFVMQGISTTQNAASQRSSNRDLYTNATVSYYVSIGTWVLLGVTVADMLYRTYQYLTISGEGTASLAK
jgi:hypothetical protein